MASISMNTMVSIEKGVSTDQLELYLQALNTLGITEIFNPIANIMDNTVDIQSMT